MAESLQEIMTFLNDVPSEIEQAQRAMFSSNSHVIEHWHMRLENSNNFILVLIDEMQRRLESNHEELNLRSLRAIQREVRDVYRGIDMLLFEGHGAVEGMRTPAVTVEGNGNTNNTNFHRDNSATQQGRPRKEATREQIETMFGIYRSWKVVAHLLGISQRTLRRRRQEHGMALSETRGPRLTYTQTSNEDLCNTVRSILFLLPDVGETLVIGALRARGIYVQRRRVRYAIMEVDPINRALRRTVSIVRRTIFYYMEQINILDPLNPTHLYCLHATFLPRLNEVLQELLHDWNNHPMSSASNMSPDQLWHLGLANYRNQDVENFNLLTNYDWDSFGIDPNGPVSSS
eukprot:gene13230-14588_t